MDANQIETKAPRWGLLGTFISCFTIATAYIMVSTLVTIFYIVVNTTNLNELKIEEKAKEIELNGTVLAITSILSLFICGGLIIGAAKLKKGSNLKEYFGFKSFSFKTLFLWIFVFALLILGLDLLTVSLGKPVVPDVMKTITNSTDHQWLLFFAIIISAPILEELFFRGLMFEGISSSALGPYVAIFLTSLIWSAIHLQYDLYGMTSIFFIGIMLGYVKYKTGSIYLTMILHTLNNTISTIELLLS